MKLDKDNTQKIVLAVILLVGLVYCYFTMLLGPLDKGQIAATHRMAELTPQIAAARETIKATQALEAKAPVANETLEQIKGMIPMGAPIAWFPPRMADFFKRQGIEKSATRLSGDLLDPSMPGFRKLLWTIDLPKVEFVPLAIAIQGLENEEPLIEVTSLQIATGGDPQFQHASITLCAIVRQ